MLKLYYTHHTNYIRNMLNIFIIIYTISLMSNQYCIFKKIMDDFHIFFNNSKLKAIFKKERHVLIIELSYFCIVYNSRNHY